MTLSVPCILAVGGETCKIDCFVLFFLNSWQVFFFDTIEIERATTDVLVRIGAHFLSFHL